MLRHLFSLGLLFTIAHAAIDARAQDYPTKAVRIIVPFPPGSPADIRARMIAAPLAERFKQPVIVDNRPGAGGNIAVSVVAKSPADGHTLLYANSGQITINPHIYRNLGFDVLKDLTPAIQLVSIPFVLVVDANLPVKNFAELSALAKAKPDAFTYASSGAGTPQHLAMELLKSMAGFNATHIPYKGENQSLMDVANGQVSMQFATPVGSLPHIKGGKLRPVAVSSTKRVRSLPNVPTPAEAGIAGYESGTWAMLLVPSGTPAATINKINKEVAAILLSPQIKQKEEDFGNEVMANSPEQAAAVIRQEYARNAKLVKDIQLSIE